MPGPITPLPTPPSTDDPSNFESRGDEFLGALPGLAEEINEFAASLNSLSTTTGSVTSVAIGTGTKNFVVEPGKSLFPSMSYKMGYDANNWVLGDIISYDTGTGALSLDVDTVRGSGTYAAWVGTLAFNGQIESEQIKDLSVVESKLALALLRKLTKKRLVDFDAVVAGNDLIITINPGTWDFRSTTLTDGTPTEVTLSSPVTITVPNGATLGTINGQAARLAVLAINNGGAIEAAVVNLAGGNQLDETNLITTTTIGTGADSNNVIYSTTGRTNVAYRLVGFIDITEAAAGVWATGPTLVQPTGGQALATLSGIGYGQTWQNVAGSRSSGVTYYNTTGKPISVSIFTNGALASTDISLTVNGIIVAYGRFSVAGNTGRAVCQAIVPPGGSYEANIVGTFAWVELR
jgi:hypothetical protein